MKEGKTLFWEIADQVAHFLVGCAAVLIMMIPVMIWFPEAWKLAYVAVLVTMTGAVVREHLQHPWQCNLGCLTDLSFWLIGCAAAVNIVYFGFV